MQLKLQLRSWTLSLACLMLLSAGSCGDDTVEPETWMLGHFSGSLPGAWERDGVTQFDIRPDGTVLWIEIDGCGSYRSESTYAWRHEGSDTIVIAVDTFPMSLGTRTVRIDRNPECDRLHVTHIQNGNEGDRYTAFRGELCLRLPGPGCEGHGCATCVATWCDDPRPATSNSITPGAGRHVRARGDRA